jgi:integrase
VRRRHVVLSSEGIEFFNQQWKDKLPSARLFTEDGETPWRRHVWARVAQAAIRNHYRDASAKRRISGYVTAYSFRHTRISELLQLYGVDPLTVAAAQTGASIAMIEKGYLRFIPSAMKEKLEAFKG